MRSYIGEMLQVWQQTGKASPTFHAPAAWRGTLSTCRAAVGADDGSSTGCLPTAAVCMHPSATCLLPPIFATPHWSVSTEHRIIIIIIVIILIIYYYQLLLCLLLLLLLLLHS